MTPTTGAPRGRYKSTQISLSSAQAIKPYITSADTDATSCAMTPDHSALVALIAAVHRSPSGLLGPKTDAGHQAVKAFRVPPRNNKVRTTPATNPPMCAM